MVILQKEKMMQIERRLISYICLPTHQLQDVFCVLNQVVPFQIMMCVLSVME